MYILIVSYKNGDVAYFGPFLTEDRAQQYSAAVVDDPQYARHHIDDIVVPNCTIVRGRAA